MKFYKWIFYERLNKIQLEREGVILLMFILVIYFSLFYLNVFFSCSYDSLDFQFAVRPALIRYENGLNYIREGVHQSYHRHSLQRELSLTVKAKTYTLQQNGRS